VGRPCHPWGRHIETVNSDQPPNPITRRRFIRNASAAAAGASLLPATLPQVHASVDEEIKATQ